MWGTVPAGKDLNTVGKDQEHLANAIQEELGKGEATCETCAPFKTDQSRWQVPLSRSFISDLFLLGFARENKPS